VNIWKYGFRRLTHAFGSLPGSSGSALQSQVRRQSDSGGAADHCSAPEAAEMARDAGAQVLSLTYHPDKVDPNAIRNAARSVFKGEVHVVQDGDRFSLAQRNLGQYLGGAQGRTQGGRSP
jgi:hypothetical protein